MNNSFSGLLASLGISADAAPFDIFREELLRTNEVMNLTAITDPGEVNLRHFADSLALLSAYDFSGKRVIDVGCGAGFPGLPLRLARDDISLTLLDALAKRITFLQGVCDRLGLSDVECIHARAEELAANEDYREGYDIAVSRAVADLRMLCELTLPFVKVGGAFLAMKAHDCDDEIKSAENAVKILGGFLEARADQHIGLGVDRAGGVVKNKDLGLFEKCASDTKSLLLTARYVGAALFDLGVVAVGE
ncbi:MAG: 16S rRNA (guanine(527)-N(7))-methyltransferase RsmG, partial [Oscillospiraceae bacterium]|nr:16S rRNA (guanine(527)-N(7))-methyltransferase RsmG [Oscillospiraceae bacterium]